MLLFHVESTLTLQLSAEIKWAYFSNWRGDWVIRTLRSDNENGNGNAVVVARCRSRFHKGVN